MKHQIVRILLDLGFTSLVISSQIVNQYQGPNLYTQSQSSLNALMSSFALISDIRILTYLMGISYIIKAANRY
jgi:hypothetical protein